jgi:hypothetical protein
MNRHIFAEAELVGTYKHALQFQCGTGEVGFENFVEFPE